MKYISTLLLLLVINLSFSQKTIIDNYYQSEKDKNNFLNYKVVETNSEYSITLNSSSKDNSMSFNLRSNTKKNALKTLKSCVFSLMQSRNDSKETIKMYVNVEEKNDSLIWTMKNENRIKSKHSTNNTIDNITLWFILTTLNMENKGRILEFNSMETIELNYKENHHLDYVADETLNINGKEIKTKKITQNGDGIRESTYWVDQNNKLVKISIDNYKNLILCSKEDISKNQAPDYNRSQFIVTATSGLSIRDEPNIYANKIGKLDYESIVDVIKETDETYKLKDGENVISGNWIKIKIPETDKEGYAFGGYLNALEDKLPNTNHPLKYRLNALISKDMPAKDTIQYNHMKPCHILNKKEWQEFGFDALYEFAEESYVSQNIYRVKAIENGFVFFIERHHDNEAFHWLCLVDHNFKLKNHINIAYDNAEGFTGTETHFKDEKIIVDYYNIYEKPENKSTTYKIKNLTFQEL